MRIHYSHHLTSTPGRTSRAEHQSEHASLHTSSMMEYDGGFFSPSCLFAIVAVMERFFAGGIRVLPRR